MVTALRRIVEKMSIEVVSVRQKRPLGLGHAAPRARDLVGSEPFAVMLADDLVDSESSLRQATGGYFQPQKEKSVIALLQVPLEEVHQYGVIEGKEIYRRIYEIQTKRRETRRQRSPFANGNHWTGMFCARRSSKSCKSNRQVGAGRFN